MTPLVIERNLAHAAMLLLAKLGDYPSGNERAGFHPSLLRYKVKSRDEVQGKGGYEDLAAVGTNGGPLVSKIMAVTSAKTWYDDDDFFQDQKRLGGDERIESIPRKQQIEKILTEWCKTQYVREHVQTAIDQLCPPRWRSALAKYGVKVDLYTNRVLPGWHQDWDDGHALFVGLMNMTTHASTGIPVKGAEILDFTPDALSPFDGSLRSGVYAAASTTRRHLMDSFGYQPLADGLRDIREDQAFGAIRWFNDAVLVHRTPPFAANALARDIGMAGNYSLDALNSIVGVGDSFVELPRHKLTDQMKDRGRYDLENSQGRELVSRSLLRITVREWRKHKA